MRQRKTDTDRTLSVCDRYRQRERDRQRETDRERETVRQRETDRKRDRERQTERDRQTVRQRQRVICPMKKQSGPEHRQEEETAPTLL